MAVQAIKDLQTIDRIRDLLNKHYNDLYADIWVFGINVALRISDIVPIKYTDIQNTPDGWIAELVEQKTKKRRIVNLNKRAMHIIEERRKLYPDDIYLFQPHATNTQTPKPICRKTVASAFKDIGTIVDQRLGTHSMRKTRGYHLYKKTNDLALVQKVLNHSSSAQTLRYIGINPEDVASSYHSLELG